MERIKNANDLLKEQVEREVAHLVSPPQSVTVFVDNGKVMLDGPIYEDEAEQLLKVVQAIPGVASVENRLDSKRR